MINKDLRELLDYNQETGIFTWRIRKAGVKPSRIAGKINSKGYWLVTANKKTYRAHRLAWWFMTGEWPPEQIDHINGNKLDNRFCNLRLANNSQNHMNMAPRANNSSGVPGVSWDRSRERWIVTITKDYKTIHLGRFDDFYAARIARQEAAAALFGQYARTS